MKNINKQIAIMQAHASGKKIEYSENGTDWTDVQNPAWNWERYYYRIKEEPKYRPFKDADECWNEMLKHEPFGWVIQKSNGIRRYISAVYEDYVEFIHGYTYKGLVKDYTFADGTPFGIKED